MLQQLLSCFSAIGLVGAWQVPQGFSKELTCSAEEQDTQGTSSCTGLHGPEARLSRFTAEIDLRAEFANPSELRHLRPETG